MNKHNMQSSMKSALDRADKILAEAGENSLTTEQLTVYKAAVAEAHSFKDQIDELDKVEALKSWQNESTGSAVRASFTSADMDGHGNLPEIAAEQIEVTTAPTGRKSVTGGELYSTGGMGENKLKNLKSGEYKDAYNDYLRHYYSPRGMKAPSMKILQEGIDESGGFWIPPDLRTEMIRKIAVMATVRPNAYTFTTGSDIASFPKVTYTTDDKYSSSVRASWAFEAPTSNISESANPVAGRVNISVDIATAAIYLTRQQVEDNSFDILGYVSQELAMAFSLLEEDAFINGDGVAKPQGILKHANATVASSSGGMQILSGTAGAVAWGLSSSAGTATTGVIGVEAALPPQYEEGARWLANKNTYAALRALTDTQTRPLWQTADSYPNVANGYAPNLLGYSTLRSQFMPSIGSTALPLALGNLQGYFIADRVGLSIEVLREVAALRDMVVLYARKRVGGQLVKDWMIKLMKSNNS